jgi:hypothetical protein
MKYRLGDRERQNKDPQRCRQQRLKMRSVKRPVRTDFDNCFSRRRSSGKFT